MDRALELRQDDIASLRKLEAYNLAIRRNIKHRFPFDQAEENARSRSMLLELLTQLRELRLTNVSSDINIRPYDLTIVEVESSIASESRYASRNFGFSRTKAYKYENSDSLDNIVYANGSVNIKYITVSKLIEKLTRDSFAGDLNLIHVFMLTYRSFITPLELLDRLEERYFVPFPPNITPSELVYFSHNVQAPIQIKIFGIIKIWINRHFADFEDSPESLDRLKQLLRTLDTHSTGPWAKKSCSVLSNLLARKTTGDVRELHDSKFMENSLISPALSVSSVVNDFLNLSDVELGRQISLRDWVIFKKVKSHECLYHEWSSQGDRSKAPNIVAMIENWKFVVIWVQLEIISQVKLSNRVLYLKKFLKIAEVLYLHQNFHSLFAIYCALNSLPIHRMKRTWIQIGSKSQKIFDDLGHLFCTDDNSAILRQTLRHATGPCIPYIGLFLSDLIFVDEGASNPPDGMINFSKCRLKADRILWIQQFQSLSYPFKSLPNLQEYLSSKMQLVDEDILWKMSVEVEPREV